MPNKTRFFAIVFATLVASCSAGAADLPIKPPDPASGLLAPAATPFFVRLGAAAVLPDTDIAVRLGGVPVAGGNGSIDAVPAVYVEAGAYLTHNIAVSLSGGYPPTFATRGTGVLAPFGTLYKAEVGLPVFEASYHFDNFGPVRPYLGVGVGYAIVFRNEAASVAVPRLKDSAAFVLVGGFDVDLTAHWGVFADVKKAFLTQGFTGVSPPFPGAPAFLPTTARVRTDPILVSSGIQYRF